MSTRKTKSAPKKVSKNSSAISRARHQPERNSSYEETYQPRRGGGGYEQDRWDSVRGQQAYGRENEQGGGYNYGGFRQNEESDRGYQGRNFHDSGNDENWNRNRGSRNYGDESRGFAGRSGNQYNNSFESQGRERERSYGDESEDRDDERSMGGYYRDMSDRDEERYSQNRDHEDYRQSDRQDRKFRGKDSRRESLRDEEGYLQGRPTQGRQLDEYREQDDSWDRENFDTDGYGTMNRDLDDGRVQTRGRNSRERNQRSYR